MTETDQKNTESRKEKHKMRHSFRILLSIVIAAVLILLGRVLSGNMGKQSVSAESTESGNAVQADENGKETVACPDGSFGCTYEYAYDEKGNPVQRTYRMQDGSEIETIDLNQ